MRKAIISILALTAAGPAVAIDYDPDRLHQDRQQVIYEDSATTCYVGQFGRWIIAREKSIPEIRFRALAHCARLIRLAFHENGNLAASAAVNRWERSAGAFALTSYAVPYDPNSDDWTQDAVMKVIDAKRRP